MKRSCQGCKATITYIKIAAHTCGSLDSLRKVAQ